jgi:hypothetical protein
MGLFYLYLYLYHPPCAEFHETHKCLPKERAVFQKPRSHLNILRARSVTQSKFHAEDLRILCITVKISCHGDLVPGFVHPSLRSIISRNLVPNFTQIVQQIRKVWAESHLRPSEKVSFHCADSHQTHNRSIHVCWDPLYPSSSKLEENFSKCVKKIIRSLK